MTDLERFFRRLVRNLAATDPARLREPIRVGEIRSSIVPYRSNRRVLQLDTSEDYELVLLRLCAGEGGLASTSPEEVRARFEQELASPNPALDVLHQFRDALVNLAPGRIASALAEGPEAAHAEHHPPIEMLDEAPPPPEPVASPVVDAGPAMRRPIADPGSEAAARLPVHCAACGQALPSERPVKFCPHCGRNQTPASCSTCGAELEAGWRFCAACGRAT